MPRWIRVVLGIVAGLVLLIGGIYVFRSEIATAAVGFMLDRSETARCSHPQIELAASLEVATVAPFECKVSRGPLKRAETFGPMRVRLDGFGVEHVYIPRATFDARDRDVSHAETNTLGDLAGFAGMTDSLIKGMLDGRDGYSKDAIPMSIGQLTTLREGKKDGVMYDYREWMDGEWYRSHAVRMSSGMEGLAEVRNFDMRVTPSRARLTMGIYLGEAERGEEPDAEMRLESKNLDAPKPKFDLSLDTDESREARRARKREEAREARHAKAKAPARD